jgi:hypothetical protein
MKKNIKFAVLGFLLAVTAWIVYIFVFSSHNPSRLGLDFALKKLERDQERLGVQCLHGDSFLLDYVDAATAVAEKIVNGKQLKSDDPIHLMGEKVSEVISMCRSVKGMMEVGNYDLLSNIVLVDDLVMQEATIIRLSISRSTAKWCEVKCVHDARNKILENASLLRQRVLSHPLKLKGA